MELGEAATVAGEKVEAEEAVVAKAAIPVGVMVGVVEVAEKAAQKGEKGGPKVAASEDTQA